MGWVSDTGWTAIALLGTVAMVLIYLGWVAWLGSKRPPAPRRAVSRVLASAPPMWTSTTTTVTTKKPDEPTEPEDV